MTDTLGNKHILVGVTGGIAAYKSISLVRQLIQQGAKVRVVMTEAAKAFVTPLTFQVVSGEKVRDNLFDMEAEAAMGHIELARWADMIVIAPLSANSLASLVYGFSDTLLSTLCLASKAPLYVCPAMNQQMWSHPATEKNVSVLKERGVTIIGPAYGEQACGDTGLGRMSEVDDIIASLMLKTATPFLNNCRVLITAGPTQEAIDPVRYMSNHSSGKMGYALAESARDAGATVTLITGPTALNSPEHVTCVDVVSAHEMLVAVQTRIEAVDIFISCAAVCDYYCMDIEPQKIKKTTSGLMLHLNQTQDILSYVGHLHSPPYVVGFAAETTSLDSNALKKLKEKKCDMVVANRVGVEDTGFNSDENEVSVFTKEAKKHFIKENKKQLAKKIIQYIATHYQKGYSHGT